MDNLYPRKLVKFTKRKYKVYFFFLNNIITFAQKRDSVVKIFY